jgi:hypothetical protein
MRFIAISPCALAAPRGNQFPWFRFNARPIEPPLLPLDPVPRDSRRTAELNTPDRLSLLPRVYRPVSDTVGRTFLVPRPPRPASAMMSLAILAQSAGMSHPLIGQIPTQLHSIFHFTQTPHLVVKAIE